MAIYVFNLLVGYYTGGLDTAQGVRSRYLRKTKHNVKYIFDTVPTYRELLVYHNLGICVEEMLCAQLFMTGNYNFAGNIKVSDKLQELVEKLQVNKTVEIGNSLRLYHENQLVASIERKENKEFLYQISYYHNNGKLILTEWYGDSLLYTDHFVTAEKDGKKYAKKVKTSFFDKKGTNVYDCLYDINGEELYVYPDGQSYSKTQWFYKFIQALKLSEDDIVILERPSFNSYVQPLFQYGGKAKKVVVFHSGHYFERGEDTGSLYMNREYYYWFKYSEKIDLMIVSTEEQKEDIRTKLLEFSKEIPRIEVVPAGGLADIKRTKEFRKPHSLVTVSRLVPGKKVDWVIESVIEARKGIPELTLDIYGEGKATSALKELVHQYNAEEYIHFMGHCDVSEVYKNYEGYISGSVFETLGLSVMEAIGSGNAVIGLDARYGNRVLIEDGKNGRLIKFSPDDIQNPQRVKEIISDMAKCIVEVFSDEEMLLAYQEHSYQIAERFLNDKIEKKWIDVIGSL